MSVQVVPASVLCCHCSVGAGVPLTVTDQDAAAGSVTLWFAGAAAKLGAADVGNGGASAEPPPQPGRIAIRVAAIARRQHTDALTHTIATRSITRWLWHRA
jgi:hypothetical protein